MDYKAKFATEGTYVPDGLIAGNAHLLVGRQITIRSRGISDDHIFSRL